VRSTLRKNGKLVRDQRQVCGVGKAALVTLALGSGSCNQSAPEASADSTPLERAVANLDAHGILVAADSVDVRVLPETDFFAALAKYGEGDWGEGTMAGQLLSILERTTSNQGWSPPPMEVQPAAVYLTEEQWIAVNGALLGANKFTEDLLEYTLTHELVHWNQDRRHSLAQRMNTSDHIMDEVAVVKLIAEGEAHYIATTVEVEKRDSSQFPSPPFDLSSAMEFGLRRGPAGLPYLAGGEYIARIASEDGGFSSHDLWCTLPLSSEQILHPEKRQDPPVRLEFQVADGTSPSWVLKRTDVLGEFSVYWLLSHLVQFPLEADLASIGWGGDLVGEFEDESGRSLMAWRSLWDCEEDAVQFAAVMDQHALVVRRGRFVDVAVSEDTLRPSELSQFVESLLLPGLSPMPDGERTSSEAEESAREYWECMDHIAWGNQWRFPKAGVTFLLPEDEYWAPLGPGETGPSLGEIGGTLSLVTSFTEPRMPNLNGAALVKYLAERVAVRVPGGQDLPVPVLPHGEQEGVVLFPAVGEGLEDATACIAAMGEKENVFFVIQPLELSASELPDWRHQLEEGAAQVEARGDVPCRRWYAENGILSTTDLPPVSLPAALRDDGSK